MEQNQSGKENRSRSGHRSYSGACRSICNRYRNPWKCICWCLKGNRSAPCIFPGDVYKRQVLTIFSKGIISQFTKDDLEMIRVGTQSLRINGISFMLFGFYTVYSSLFLALGKGLAGFILGACRQGICLSLIHI